VQVPYTLGDEQLPDDWQCKHNVWDPAHASCSIPQELSNEEIDAILALQDDEAAEAAAAAALAGVAAGVAAAPAAAAVAAGNGRPADDNG
jgi:hypothetical protein